ncbi:hypothetical protein J2T13_005131 [Paenibacillus sp. DS2015]|uniref:copper amine oxidase N-terminal domain-containing protein n=1 Tax=Paenibacillus sp. DS2015 TaxID=3373917 RepID=UPI003D2164B2
MMVKRSGQSLKTIGSIGIASMLVLTGIHGTTQVQAASISKSASIEVIIDGGSQIYAQSPIMQNGVVLVPMRGVFESLGAVIKYVPETKTILAVKGSKEISITLGKSTATVNGIPKKLSVPANTYSGVTMVPLRFVSEALEANVKWDQSAQSVMITSVGVTPGDDIVYTQQTPETTKITAPVTDAISPTNKYAISVPKNQWKSVRVGDYKFTGKGYTVSNYKQISVEFGNHAYGSQTQAEYNYVMKIVKEEVDKLFVSGGLYDQIMNNQTAYPYKKAYDGYIAGDRTVDIQYTKGREYALALGNIERYETLIANKVPFSELMKLQAVGSVYSSKDSAAKYTDNGEARSLYDMLYHKITDCDPQAYLVLAITDYLGYNGMAYANSGHASPLVQLGSKWYDSQAFGMNGSSGAMTYAQAVAKGASNGGVQLATPTYDALK